MNTAAIIVLVMILVALTAILYVLFERRRMRKVRAKFGSEYDRVVGEGESPRHAVAVLEKREKRVEKYHIRALSPEECMRFVARWRTVQEHFVDNPRSAIWEADHLVNEALQTKGYPMSDFEHQVADLSVNHARVVDEYRFGHRIAMGSQQGQYSTEDLRIGMQHYRNLFEEISDINVAQEVHR
jgi:hypothetical protein